LDEPRYCYRHPDRETGLSCSECGRPICYECMTPAPVGLRCPEHSGKPQGIRKVTAAAERAATGRGSRRPLMITMVLIGINVTVYLAELAAGGSANGLNNEIFYKGALFAHGYFHGSPGVADGGWWRIVTAMFLHYGPIHLLLNMYSLYFAGSILETVIGRWRFALLYLVSGIAGSAGALVNSPDQLTVGASGAIFGILGALFVLERRRHISTGGQIAGLIVFNLVLTFTLSSIISVGGHVGGLIGGVILMWAFLRIRSSVPLTVGSAAAVAAAVVVIAYASI
jgi:membrane associated rhomboid family serine protease